MVQPLALELYYAIIQHVDNTDDLLSLALCCSVLQDEAQRCLFRFVGPKSKRRHTQLISAINTSPLRLGPLIYAYCINEITGLYKNSDDHEALSLALRSMCNLQHLRNERRLSTTVLQGCTFNLRTLVWNNHMFESDALFLFRHFLPTQPSIKRLDLSRSDLFHLEKVPTDLCPMLDSLQARDDNTVNALLRDNRLITRFQWSVIGESLPLTTRQINRLEYLVCYIQDIDASFTQKLISLVFLGLSDSSRPNDFDIVRMLQFLQDLPCLEVLVVDTPYNYHTDVSSAYRDAFKLRPTLKYIDAPPRDYNGKFFHRVYRPEDGEDGVLVGNTRVHEREVLGWRREYGVGPAWSKYI